MKQFLIVAAASLALAGAALAEGMTHKVAIHVDENDPAVMNMALNNVQNVVAYYKGKGDTVQVEVVTYGPGLTMLVADKSPVADRIAAMSLENETLTFAACGNTLNAMKKKAGGDVPLLSEAKIVLMDEPTAAISVRQVAEVLELIRRLKDQGIAIVLISHRMPDVFAVADRVAVLRRGRKVAEKPVSQSSPEEVTGLITGAIHAA